MTYDGTLTTEEECDSFAGKNVDSSGWTEANINSWVKQAEAYLSLLIREDLVGKYESIRIFLKPMLSEYCARYTAMCGIAYNMEDTTYTNRLEAESMINIHVYRMEKIEKWIIEDLRNKFLWNS